MVEHWFRSIGVATKLRPLGLLMSASRALEGNGAGRIQVDARQCAQ